MAVTIGSNIASLKATRQLGRSSQSLGQIYEQLASGQRINRPSDDAAGLSISTTLSAKSRVYGQGIRNLSDGVSYLSIADGAIQNLKDILFRLRELSAQASNGTFGRQQRNALDVEAQHLSEEYARIVQSTSFNGRQIFQTNQSTSVQLQAGFGSDGILAVSLQGGTTINAGSGTFGAAVSLPDQPKAGLEARNITTADFNVDGNLDFTVYASDTGILSTFLGNGNGTFREVQQTVPTMSARAMATADINQDGYADVVSISALVPTVIGLGRGDGTFAISTQSLGFPGQTTSAVLTDVNGDGKLDLMGAMGGSGSTPISIALGNGNGTFQTTTSFTSVANVDTMRVADFDGDGFVDSLIQGTGSVAIHYGTGGGSFGAAVTLSPIANNRLVGIGDVNSDGLIDIVTEDGTNTQTKSYLNQGNRGFSEVVGASTISNISGNQIGQLIDINGDKMLDLVTAQSSAQSIRYLRGNDDGTFVAAVTSLGGTTRYDEIALGDFNNDSVLDVVGSTLYSVGRYIQFGNSSDNQITAKVSKLLPFSLKTLYEAKQSQKLLDDELTRLHAVSSVIGAGMSRIGIATNTLSTIRENTEAANARIRDVDIAASTSELARNTILQQAGVAVLASANVQPQIALMLLRE